MDDGPGGRVGLFGFSLERKNLRERVRANVRRMKMQASIVMVPIFSLVQFLLQLFGYLFV